MLGHIVFLTVAYVSLTRGAPLENGKEGCLCGNRGSPLTDHLLKFLNHFDDSIIGFHLVVPRDDLILNNYSERPQVSKILEYVTQINYLRNMIENDPEVSLKRNEKSWSYKTAISTPSKQINNSDPHHTDILIFSQVSPQRNDGLQLNTSKKLDDESVIFVPYPRNLDSNQKEYRNFTSNILSRAVAYKTNVQSDYKNRSNPCAGKMSNYTILKKFEDGIRVYPLISLSQRNDSIDCLTGKVNRSQQDICLMGRIRRKLSTDEVLSDGCAFLVRPLVSSNPSLIIVPKSIDNMHSKLQQSTCKKTTINKKDPKLFLSTNKETSQITKSFGKTCKDNVVSNKGDNTVEHSMTFLAPLLDSAIVLPFKSDNKAFDTRWESVGQFDSKYSTHSLPKRSAPNLEQLNQDGYDTSSASINTGETSSASCDSYNTSNMCNRLNNSYNSTGNYNVDSAFSFADILRQSISDLVYGDYPGLSDNAFVQNAQPKRSNTSLNDFNVYLLLDSEKRISESGVKENSDKSSCEEADVLKLYSSPKSKTLEGFDENNFVCFRNYWPSLSLKRNNKTKLEIPIKTIFKTNFHDNDAFTNVNSLYKERIEHILSYAKKGRYGFFTSKRRRHSDQLYDNGNIETVNYSEPVKYVPENMLEDIGVCDRNDLVFERRKRATDSSVINRLPGVNVDQNHAPASSSSGAGILCDNAEPVSQSQNADLKKKVIDRINRSLGRIFMIPQVDRNLDLLIVYPYSGRNNKKTIVSKSVKKYSLEKRKKPTSETCNILQKLVYSTKKPDFKIQLDRKFYNELTKQKAVKPDYSYKIHPVKIDQRITDSSKAASYHEIDVNPDTSPDQSNFLPINLISWRSSSSNFADAVSQNLSYGLADMETKAVNISDLPTEKSVENISIPTFYSDESTDLVNSSDPNEGMKD